jgi:small subunit ribosomal protein S20
MANIKSAEKRNRQAKKRQQVNRSAKSEVLTIRKSMESAMAEGNAGKSAELFKKYSSILDKSVKKGVLKKNSASRRKSRAAKKLAAV